MTRLPAQRPVRRTKDKMFSTIDSLNQYQAITILRTALAEVRKWNQLSTEHAIAARKLVNAIIYLQTQRQRTL